MPDTAILHDQFGTMGGAERVAVELARALRRGLGQLTERGGASV